MNFTQNISVFWNILWQPPLLAHLLNYTGVSTLFLHGHQVENQYLTFSHYPPSVNHLNFPLSVSDRNFSFAPSNKAWLELAYWIIFLLVPDHSNSGLLKGISLETDQRDSTYLCIAWKGMNTSYDFYWQLLSFQGLRPWIKLGLCGMFATLRQMGVRWVEGILWRTVWMAVTSVFPGATGTYPLFHGYPLPWFLRVRIDVRLEGWGGACSGISVPAWDMENKS